MAEVHSPEAYLARARTPFTSEAHPRVVSAQRLAHELHVSGYQVAKTVLVQADWRVWIAVVAAPTIVDLDRLRESLNARSVRLLEEGEFAPLFPDCEPGAEPPLGTMYGLPVIVDLRLAEQQTIVFRAGSHDRTITMSFADFHALVSPRVGRFAYVPLVPTLDQVIESRLGQ